MQCSECGTKVRGTAAFCPTCGHKLEQPAPVVPDKTENTESPWEPAPAKAEQQGCSRSLLVALVALLVVLAIAGLAVAGVYFGLKDRARAEHQAAAEHYALGLARMEEKDYEMAIAEFDLVVRLDPSQDRARAKIAEARRMLEATPTPAPTPTPRPKLEQDVAGYFEGLRLSYEKRDWPATFEYADSLLALDTNYHRDEVNQMLFEAFYDSGQQLVAEDRLEEAVRYFDRALALQSDKSEVIQARQLASLYLRARGYWNADWDKVIENLLALHELAPNYKDVQQLMLTAHIQHGDALAENQDWCAAEQQYSKALELAQLADVIVKEDSAHKLCGTVGPVATARPGTPAPSGTFTGRLAQLTSIDGGKILIRGRVLDHDSKGVGGTQVQIQAWDFKTVSVTDGNGQFSFDGLTNPVTYTLSLLNHPSVPFNVAGQWGKLSTVDFQEAK
jgi:tetratricopeptide (TPR) repeat protein